jgi:apolipoprotein N-acyltransferase
MKALLALLTLALFTAHAAASERVQLYARITENLNAELTDGTIWQIDKGDCFPVIAYVDSHTKLVLRLATAQFVVRGKSAVIVSEKETPAAIENYKVSLNSYMTGVAMRWRAKAEAGNSK